MKERKGFDSNLHFIREYLIAFCEYLLGNPVHKEQILRGIFTMKEFDLVKLLKSFRLTMDG